jgi:hypothetical protein
MPIGVLNCIHKPSVGDPVACRASFMPVADAINASDELGDSLKCSTSVIVSREHANTLFFAYDKVQEVIGSVFPFIWISISYDSGRVPRAFFDPIMVKYGLIPIVFGTRFAPPHNSFVQYCARAGNCA